MINSSQPPVSIGTDRAFYAALDAHDALAPLREQFVLPPGQIYLDGNSLGVCPKTVLNRVAQVIEHEWGQGLVTSWNNAGWIDLPKRVGDAIAPLIGAEPGQIVCADSTSINVFKVLAAALKIQQLRAPTRHSILSVSDNFPTDLYMAQGLAELIQGGLQLQLLDAHGASTDPDQAIINALKPNTAVLMLTHVNYRTGYMHDMARLTQAAHDAGALVIWDLAHSAGAVPVDVLGCNADFAVGCGYKYLNGGPGAPAFVWVNPKYSHEFTQPLSGWLGHQAPFKFDSNYTPATGVSRYLCGTPAIISMAALECGVITVRAADAMGGMEALRAKSLALTEHFMQLIERDCAGQIMLASPRAATQRGSQVCLTHPTHAYAIVQALIAQGVIGDFRAPNVARFGFTPLYTRYVDVWDAVQILKNILTTQSYLTPAFMQHNAVT